MKRLILPVTIVTILFTALCAGCKPNNGAGGLFRFPLSGEPRQLDPQASSDAPSITVMDGIFEGLAALEQDGSGIISAVPGAADWQVSGDGLIYTFTLRESMWSDGTPVTADDFLFAIQRTADPATKSPHAGKIHIIAGARDISEGKKSMTALGVEAIGKNVLKITLTNPSGDFPAMTASAPFFPCNRAFFEQTAGQYGLEAEYTLSNGPFEVSKWNHGDSVLLNKNEQYRDAAEIMPAAVRYMIAERGDPLTEIAEGNLDAAWVSWTDTERANEKKLQVIPKNDTVCHLLFNHSITELSNAGIRRALRDALEWDAVRDILDGAGSAPATGFVSPDAVTQSGMFREVMPALEPAQSDAASQLSAALSEIGLGGLSKITLLCADDEMSTELARMIIQSWQKNLSLFFSVEPLTPSALDARVKTGNYLLALYSFTAPGYTAGDALGCFASTSPQNYTRFSDTGFDRALSAADPLDANAAAALEKQLWDACPSIPIAFVPSFAILTRGMRNVEVRSFGGGAFGAEFDFRRAVK